MKFNAGSIGNTLLSGRSLSSCLIIGVESVVATSLPELSSKIIQKIGARI